MPWISVTLFCTKYSSQEALRLELLQKRPQRAVVTVPLLATCVLAQASKLRFARVRFPRRQTLRRAADPSSYHFHSRPVGVAPVALTCHVTTARDTHTKLQQLRTQGPPSRLHWELKGADQSCPIPTSASPCPTQPAQGARLPGPTPQAHLL